MVIEPMKYGPMKPGLMVIHSIGYSQPDPKYGPIKYRLMVFVPCKYLLPSLKYGHMKYGLMVIGYMRIGHLCETQFMLSETYYNKI